MKKSKLISLILAVAMVMSMIVLPAGAEPAADPKVCPVHPDATWTEIAESTWKAGKVAPGHYRLTGDQATTAALTIAAGTEVCIDLNGHNITAGALKASGSYRTFAVNGKLTIMDSAATTAADGTYTSGVISGGRISDGTTGDLGPKGGNVLVDTGATFNLYSGAIKDGAVRGTGQGTHRFGGNVYVRTGAEFNMYGGLISGGKIQEGSYLNSSNYHGGCNIGAFGDVNIYGGTVKDGVLDNWSLAQDKSYRENLVAGGNISILKGKGLDGNVNELYISDAVISGGKAINDRTNTYNYPNSSGVMLGSTDYAYGGNINARNVNVTIHNSVITGGEAITEITPNPAMLESPYRYTNAYGGNLFVISGNLTITGKTVISEGVVRSANLWVEGATGECQSNGYGGNIYHKTGTLTISDEVTISDGYMTCYGRDGVRHTGSGYTYGGNLYLESVTLDVDDATITGGINDNYRGGSLYLTGCKGSFDNTTISGGQIGKYKSGRGGNLYVYNCSSLAFNHCTVSGGKIAGTGRGGNLFVAGSSDTITINGGTWTAAAEPGCEYGANIYTTDTSVKLIIGGGATLIGSTAKYGGNVASMYGNLTINDATLKDGKSTTAGGNLYMDGTSAGATTVLNAGAKLENGNIYVSNTDVPAEGATRAVNTLTIKTGAIVGAFSAAAAEEGTNVTVEDGVISTSNPAKYMTGEAHGLSEGKYTTYGTLAAALAAAEAGDTTTLVKDVDAGNADLNVKGMLNLNGKKITNAMGVDASFNDAAISDSVGTGSVSATHGVKVNNANGQVAIATEAGGAVCFETVSLPQQVTVTEEDGKTTATVKFFVDKLAENTLLDEALKSNPESVKLRITVTWTGDDGLQKIHSYVYQADMIEKYLAVWNTGMLTCKISGLEQLTDFAITADVFAGGVVVNGNAQ